MSTALYKKLGYKDSLRVLLYNCPKDYIERVGDVIETCQLIDLNSEGDLDLIHAFFTELSDLENMFETLKSKLKKDAAFWISWPKRSSKRVTDLDKMVVMEYGLSKSLVDVKVASYDDTWSCLKFVYRLKDRN